jgi:ketosteroid isomerase-like protein
MQAMVKELWDRDQIWQCLNRYARGVDRFDRELILSAYHADAVDEHGKFVGGPTEFVDWALGQHAEAHLSHQHCLLNHTCELHGDTAYTETYFILAAMYREGKPFRMNGGRYADRFEKRNGEWRIAYRICLRDWGMMDELPDMNDLSSFTSTRALLSNEERALMNGGPAAKRDRTDPSYWRPLEADPERVKAYAILKARSG